MPEDEAPDLTAVSCSACGDGAEIMTPAPEAFEVAPFVFEGHDEPVQGVQWLCPSCKEPNLIVKPEEA
jgi:hypothetical protein